jgi:hypothetical protein
MADSSCPDSDKADRPQMLCPQEDSVKSKGHYVGSLASWIKHELRGASGHHSNFSDTRFTQDLFKVSLTSQTRACRYNVRDENSRF